MSPYGSVRKLTILITFLAGRFDGTRMLAQYYAYSRPSGGCSLFFCDGYPPAYLTGMDFLCGTGTALMLF
ncbi:hypothetical protein SAMN05216386_1058 [Nitrosospira briensis]|uniref:Uncharacterized protein n=1 Tax=Nitrosospira briensis TaxID=35799 RepID=A0A1I4Z6M6_9PROT|nr:hypothetical protein SAMN05216386_1058 [Nitrosospira briensis]SFO23360.1 hypothetical protein SAMN05216332_10876 [Nitrosospira briensis]